MREEVRTVEFLASLTTRPHSFTASQSTPLTPTPINTLSLGVSLSTSYNYCYTEIVYTVTVVLD